MEGMTSPAGSSSVASVGGAVGGVIVALLLLAVIVIMCVAVLVRKQRHRTKNVNGVSADLGIDNVLYEGGIAKHDD